MRIHGFADVPRIAGGGRDPGRLQQVSRKGLQQGVQANRTCMNSTPARLRP